MANVIGIDTSLTCTGWAKIYDDRPMTTGTIKTLASTPLSKRLDAIYSGVLSQVVSSPTSYAFLEQPFEGGKGPSSWKNGLALAAAMLALQHMAIPVMLIAPKQRAKYATGKGNAGKDEVLAAAIRRLGYKGSNNNEADALWIAMLGLEWLPQGFDPFEGWPFMSEASLSVVDTLTKATGGIIP